MLDSSPGTTSQFALDADQIAVRDIARAFADEYFAPNALNWDEAKHFPVAEMRKAAALGMAGIYIIRAAIVDKDRKPVWRPDRLDAVTPDIVERHFKPVGELELRFEDFFGA